MNIEITDTERKFMLRLVRERLSMMKDAIKFSHINADLQQQEATKVLNGLASKFSAIK